LQNITPPTDTIQVRAIQSQPEGTAATVEWKTLVLPKEVRPNVLPSVSSYTYTAINPILTEVISNSYTSLPPTDTEQAFMTQPLDTQHPMENAFHTLEHRPSSRQEPKAAYAIHRGYVLEPTPRDPARSYTSTHRANNIDRHITYQLGAQRVRKTPEEREQDSALRNCNNKRNGEESKEQESDRSKQPRRGLDDMLVVSVNVRKNSNYLWLLDFSFVPVHVMGSLRRGEQ
jgi:hypothetical protein